MHIDDMLTVLKVRVFDTNAVDVAKEIGVTDDTLRRLLGPNPPKWLETVRRIENVTHQPKT